MGEAYCLNCMQQITNENETCPDCGVNNSNIQNDYYCLPAGTILKGRYLAGKMLGQGGFGITYVGYDSVLKLKVAIKEYYPQINVSRNSAHNINLQFGGSEEARQRYLDSRRHFLKEARRIAAVNDVPNIVTVLDVFEENETAYIVMEFAEGINLKQYLLTNGVMGLKQCLELFTPLLNSLATVHERGIIHRDISPDNIMLCSGNQLKLIDFGASKEVSSGVSSEQVIKRGFSPAEQYGGSGATGSWSDVYSICATIYYCVTGKVIPEAMDRVIEDTLSFNLPLKEPFSPAQLNAFKKGLAVKPQDRTQTVNEFLRNLSAQDNAGNNDMPSGLDKISLSDQTASINQVTTNIPGETETKVKNNNKLIGIAVAALAVLVCIPLLIFAGNQNKDNYAYTPSTSSTSSNSSYSGDYTSGSNSATDNLVTEIEETETESNDSWEEENDYLFPSDTTYLSYSDLSSLSKDEVALIRNEIYARHGYVFQTEPFKSYFSSKSWYYPNANFDASQLSAIEVANKDFLVAYEEDMGWRERETSSNNSYAGGDYLFPTDTIYISYSDVSYLSKDEVALIRNEIYARHGYVFQTEPFKSYFSSKSWYYPNPNFDASQLSAIEEANKDFLVSYEEEQGWR